MQPARRTLSFTESVIREMSRIAREDGALNLAQGFPDFPAPAELKEQACRAIQGDVNQYAVTWGSASLRHALSGWYERRYAMEVDPERAVTVTCGATEAMAAVFLALFDPGDEVVIPEPYYENYGPDAILAGAQPIFVPLTPPDYFLDPELIRERLTPRTRAIVLNTPNNPTGRSLSATELEGVAKLCRERDLVVITDEIYECLVYDGVHRPIATLPDMRERTVTVSGISKTFSVTGWRVGTIVAPEALSGAIRKVHDFLTVGAPAPLQEAAAYAYSRMKPSYFEELLTFYRERRDLLVEGLRDAGFRCESPEGSYYILADFSALSDADDHTFSRTLSREAGVAPVPGSSFFHDRAAGRSLVRFAFCKQLHTLEDAVGRLAAFAKAGA
jgi:aspartate/methionine/tyrosine aminotransferase